MARLVLMAAALMAAVGTTAALREEDAGEAVVLHRHSYGGEEEAERRWWSHELREDEEADGDGRGHHGHEYGHDDWDPWQRDRGRHGRHEHYERDGDRDSRRRAHQKEREKPKEKPPVVSVVQALRGGTESFVSSVLGWFDRLVGLDEAPFVVVDTTFSFSKSEGADVDHGVCGGGDAVGNLFPLIEKFVKSSYDEILTDEDAKSIAWAPLSACAKRGEVEGSLFATLQLTCQGHALLNVSVSTSGSTPTIKGSPIELGGVFVDVNLLDGQIKAVEAHGTVIGVIASRHYPENADEVLDKWTSIVTQCAEDKALVVSGAVGGGWTKFAPVQDGSGQFNVTAVGFTETFKFSLVAPSETIPPSALLAARAHDAATTYVQHTTVSCDQEYPPLAACHAQDVVSMAQLRSYHCRDSSDPSISTPMSSLHGHLLAASPLLAGGFLFVAMIAFMVVGQRRRTGYERLVNHETV